MVIKLTNIFSVGVGGKAGCFKKCDNCRGSGMQVRIQQIGPGMVQQIQSMCQVSFNRLLAVLFNSFVKPLHYFVAPVPRLQKVKILISPSMLTFYTTLSK